MSSLSTIPLDPVNDGQSLEERAILRQLVVDDGESQGRARYEVIGSAEKDLNRAVGRRLDETVFRDTEVAGRSIAADVRITRPRRHKLWKVCTWGYLMMMMMMMRNNGEK